MPTEVARRFIGALERHDLDAAIQCLDPRVYFDSAGENADFRTHDGFREWWELQIPSGSELHLLQIEVLDDQHVFVELVIGHPEGDGRTWSAETMCWVITADEGLIETIERFASAETALRRARRAAEMFRPDGPLQAP
jgi:hypothetical protein